VAATTQLALPARTASPFALWHLLSLDAPTVAALWTWFIARAAHVHLPAAAPTAMFLAVWILYAADRLLDAARAPASDLEARHLFHQRHQRAFLVGIAIAATALAALSPSLYPAAIHLYLVEGTLLFAWFVILHATSSAHRLPKEVAVGLFFSAAVFIPTVGRELGLRAELVPAAILFGILCSLNCLFIYAWEHGVLRDNTAHASTRLALAHLPALAVAAATAGAILTLLAPITAKPIAAACGLAAVLLLALHRNRRRLARIDLRAAADLALLTPILLLPFLR
jgi:hypothetical protein